MSDLIDHIAATIRRVDIDDQMSAGALAEVIAADLPQTDVRLRERLERIATAASGSADEFRQIGAEGYAAFAEAVARAIGDALTETES